MTTVYRVYRGPVTNGAFDHYMDLQGELEQINYSRLVIAKRPVPVLPTIVALSIDNNWFTMVVEEEYVEPMGADEIEVPDEYFTDDVQDTLQS